MGRSLGVLKKRGRGEGGGGGGEREREGGGERARAGPLLSNGMGPSWGVLLDF
jgi:hypothetical protein